MEKIWVVVVALEGCCLCKQYSFEKHELAKEFLTGFEEALDMCSSSAITPFLLDHAGIQNFVIEVLSSNSTEKEKRTLFEKCPLEQHFLQKYLNEVENELASAG